MSAFSSMNMEYSARVTAKVRGLKYCWQANGHDVVLTVAV